MVGFLEKIDSLRYLTVIRSLHSVCSTSEGLLVSIIEPPSIRIIPYPQGSTSKIPAESVETKPRLWENLAPGLEAIGKSTLLLLKDWSWLIDSSDGKD